MISRYAKERKDNKAKFKSAKNEATDSKNKLSTLQLAYDKKVRLADEAKSDYKKKLQTFKDQVAELQNSLQLDDQQSDSVVKAAREEDGRRSHRKA